MSENVKKLNEIKQHLKKGDVKITTRQGEVIYLAKKALGAKEIQAQYISRNYPYSAALLDISFKISWNDFVECCEYGDVSILLPKDDRTKDGYLFIETIEYLRMGSVERDHSDLINKVNPYYNLEPGKTYLVEFSPTADSYMQKMLITCNKAGEYTVLLFSNSLVVTMASHGFFEQLYSKDAMKVMETYPFCDLRYWKANVGSGCTALVTSVVYKNSNHEFCTSGGEVTIRKIGTPTKENIDRIIRLLKEELENSQVSDIAFSLSYCATMALIGNIIYNIDLDKSLSGQGEAQGVSLGYILGFLKGKIDDVEDKQTLESLEDKYRSLHEQLEKNVDGIGEYKGVTINGTIKYLTLMNREQLLSFSERVLELYSDFLKLWRKYNSDKRMLELIKRKQESLEKTLIEARAADFQIPMIPKQTDIGSADTSTKLSMLEALQHVIPKIPLPKDRSVHSIKNKKS